MPQQHHSPLASEAYSSQKLPRNSSDENTYGNNDFDFGPEASRTAPDDNSEVKKLEDEIRVLSIELGESVRREQKLNPSNHENDTAAELAQVYNELSLERTKRHAIEEAARSKGVDPTIHDQLADIKYSHGEAVHLLAVRTEQYDTLQTRFLGLESDFKDKQHNIDELNSKIKEIEVSRELYQQDQQINTQLKVLQEENAKLRERLDQFSDRGPLGDRVRALEDQRSALQDALRALRERKDAEIRALNTQIETLSTATRPSGSRSVSTNSLNAANTGSTSSLVLGSDRSRPRMHYPVPMRGTHDLSKDEGLQVPKLRDSTINRPASPLYMGLEYSK